MESFLDRHIIGSLIDLNLFNLAPPPRISIITPCFNHVRYIEQTILSVLNQNYPNLEFIIVDGGSTDGSVDIIRKYHTQLTWWISERDNGQTEAINKGFRKATGEIVTWLNSDDYYLPDTLKKVSRIYNEKCFDFLAGTVRIVDVNGNFIEDKPTVWPSVNERLYDSLPYVGQPATFFRRSLLDLVGYLDESFHFAMDFDFWLKLRQKKVEFTIVDEVFTCFRQHSDAKTSKGSLVFVNEIFCQYAKPKNVFNREFRHLLAHYSQILVSHDFPNTDRRILFYYLLFHPKQLLRVLLNKIKA